ncbi:MAG TPA: translation initiation factor IF-2 N-terminal domain-containing protein, partial [Bacteroidales bacterium]|nr:translation initiation factor IF-2 N-terminal domain-containing protein [Bacteroidales bacterium]
MSETKTVRLSKLARELNVGISTMVEFLKKKGYTLNPDPNSKVTPEEYDLLQKEFSTEKTIKKESEKLHLRTIPKGQVSVTINDIQKEESELTETEEEEEGIRIKDVTTGKVRPLETSADTLKKKIEEPKILGKIDLEKIEKKKPAIEEKPADTPVEVNEKEIPEEK